MPQLTPEKRYDRRNTKAWTAVNVSTALVLSQIGIMDSISAGLIFYSAAEITSLNESCSPRAKRRLLVGQLMDVHNEIIGNYKNA